MKGTIFNIQKFSVNDGPGIRTTVFMKGCPLRCLWCHNPESNSVKQELFYDPRKCISCRACMAVCDNGCHIFDEAEHTFIREGCTACGKCASVCMAGALEAVGDEKTVEEVIAEVMKDEVFYENSGGGMTLSGGEPMMQFDFTYELLKAAKEKGLHTCIETCGYAKEEQYRKIADLVDIFLFDYKETDPVKHKEYTGSDNRLIINNLKMLDDMGCNIILRCPIIPTLNDRDDHLSGIADMANILKNVLEINIEPYHPLGSGKSDMLGKEYALKELTFPEEATVQEWIDKIAEKTKVTVKRG